jgi:transposase
MKRRKPRSHHAPDPAALAPKATGPELVLHSRIIGALPIINRILQRCQLRQILWRHLPLEDCRHRVPTATAILLMVRNILISREPLYGIGQWAAAFVPELLDLHEDQLKSLNDDRVGRALERLFDANFPALLMDITRHVVREFDLELSELHNDSTTVRFFGGYEGCEQPQRRRGKITAAIRQGHSKDHRPDLKQLLYILTLTDDGGVPVYFTTDDGDKNDDQTHIATWDVLYQLTGRADFLYIADCKLASADNLNHITQHGGRFITVLPKNRSEPRAMNTTLLDQPDSVRWVLLYEVKDEDGVLQQRYQTLREEQLTADGYRLLWIHSMSKAISDDAGRMKALQKTIDDLGKLRVRLQSPRSRMRQHARVAQEVEAILERRGTRELLHVEIIEQEQVTPTRGQSRSSAINKKYTCDIKPRFDLSWHVDANQLERVRRADGVFPLVTNDRTMSVEEVLRAYKRQPLIEKRFSQFKSDFHVAPVYLKEISRIEALLCVYFLALLTQTLIERELRSAMVDADLESLPLYPESRPCRAPTTRRVIDVMDSLSRHRLTTPDGKTQDLYTDPTPIQGQLMKLFRQQPATYGRSS